MYLKTIYKAADSIAPFALSKEYCETYGAHDNSGIQLDCGNEIKRVLFSLDLSAAAISRAKASGANCIVTHHPAIFYPLSSLEAEGAGKEILECAKNGISVLSAHLNLDCAEGGIDDCLSEGLTGGRPERVMHPLAVGGYGKTGTITPCAFERFLNAVSQRFHTQRMIAYGGGTVNKIASFCGAGMDGDSVAFTLKSGADTFVSSDGKHHCIKELVENGVNVILLPHYAAEQYGFTRFYEKFQKILKEADVCAELFTDERFL